MSERRKERGREKYDAYIFSIMYVNRLGGDCEIDSVCDSFKVELLMFQRFLEELKEEYGFVMNVKGIQE